jgi:prevent-host-death family protein
MYLDGKMYKWYGMCAMTKIAEHREDRVTSVRTYSATTARQRFSDLFDEAFYKGPVIVRKNSKSVAVVSMELLKELLDVEVGEDAKRAQQALREFLSEGGTGLDDLKDELEL